MIKWLTYARQKHIDNVMKWRLKALDCQLTVGEAKQLQGKITKNNVLRHVSHKLTENFPLLDPNLTFEEAVKKHSEQA